MKIDIDLLKRLYKLSSNLRFSDIQVLINHAKLQHFEPGEYVMKGGSHSANVYFLQKGLIRIYILNDKGDEITTALNWENQIYANLDVILFQQPSRYWVQALEPTHTLYMDFEVAQEFLAQNPKLDENRRYLVRDLLKRYVRHSESFVLHSAEERYLHFVASNPDIVNRVPGKYIAHILGITPVSLSRIRKRIAQKKST